MQRNRDIDRQKRKEIAEGCRKNIKEGILEKVSTTKNMMN